MATSNKIQRTKIDSLIPDSLNANKGTEYGARLLENSLHKFGAGRSILIDRNNRIIAGNKTIEQAGAIGLENVIVIETTGNDLVAVKRIDIDLDSPEGRELAIADNASAKANISWDEENLQKIKDEWKVDTEAWGITEFMPPEDEQEEDEGKKVISTRLIVECGDIMKLSALFSELQDRGFKCELKE